MNTSRIVRFEKFGGPEVLNIEELPVEAPKAGEVLLKVQAIGLNRADALFRSGNYLEQPIFPSRIGVEARALSKLLARTLRTCVWMTVLALRRDNPSDGTEP